MNTTMSDDAVLSVTQAADYLGVTSRTVRNYLKYARNPLPYCKPAGKILIRLGDLKQWLSKK